MNKEIGLNIDRVLYNSYKILENRIGPVKTSLSMTLGCSGNLKPEMSIGGMNKVQLNLFSIALLQIKTVVSLILICLIFCVVLWFQFKFEDAIEEGFIADLEHFSGLFPVPVCLLEGFRDRKAFCFRDKGLAYFF